MTKITVYEKTTCTTCRNVSKILLEKGISYDKINYYISPFTKKKLKELLKKMGIPAVELLRKNEKMYKDLGLKDKKLKEDELISIMLLNPDLIQRPIVEKGDKAVLARPPEKINELF